ncbi:MAG TPA: hypothetical protein PLC40_13670 [Candidatus Hydrogenedentes bacterium]|nr:hypothetical protein [Candidatus Hydrogenedentota bacterium]
MYCTTISSQVLLALCVFYGFSHAPVHADVTPDAPANPPMIKLPLAFPTGMENTPVVFKGRPLLVDNHRPGGFEAKGEDAYLFITDLTTSQEVARFGEGHSFVSAFVNGDELNVFATEFMDFGHVINTKCINRFFTTDLKTWNQELALARDGEEQFFNTSVCRDDQGYLMTYESNLPVKWCFRFARSKDLSHWEKMPEIEFADTERNSVCANPTIRYFAPFYYVIYGIHCANDGPGRHYTYALPETKYVTMVARSKDLVTWDVSPTRGPMLDPVPGEGINNTDADLFEFEGNTYMYYATGDQATWGTIRVAMYAGPMKEMLEKHFPEGVPMIRFDAAQRRYLYP